MATNDERLEQARADLKRRQLFSRTFTPEVMDALEAFFGTDVMVFAFRGDMNPLDACRRDTLMGAMRSLRHEAAPEQLELAARTLEQLEKEVEHA